MLSGAKHDELCCAVSVERIHSNAAQHVHGTAQQAAVITSVITRTNAAEILESFIYHVLIYPVN